MGDLLASPTLAAGAATADSTAVTATATTDTSRRELLAIH